MTTQAALHSVAKDARVELVRIANWWTRSSVDSQRGGFLGEIGADGLARPQAAKAVVLNTRLLWFFSEAAAHLKSQESLTLAHRASAYVGQHFFDVRHGGLFWALDTDGRPLDRRKQAYAQAFGIYAFTAHFTATGDEASLDRALALFDVLEIHFLDRAGDGYWEALSETFEPISDVRLSERDLNAPKSMNTHLHVLEAYTALYRVQRTLSVENALKRSIQLMADRIFDGATGHLRLFFEADWRPIGSVVSFGHDIEASWLIWEAAEALDDDGLRALARACALGLAETALDQALGPNGELFEERDQGGAIAQRRVWWIQAEGIVGFLNAFEMTGDQRFLEAGLGVWRFVQRYQLDRDGGEWFASSTLDPPQYPPEARAGAWKCPYHTGRAMMEMERRTSLLARVGDGATTCAASG